MAILVEQKQSSFKLMEEGLHAAVISQVKDLGEQDGPYGKKRVVVARFTNAEGEEASRFYTPSLNEKATLAKDLVVLDGAIPATFDIESLVGRQVQVLVTNKTKDGKTSAKVEKLLKPKKGQSVPMPKGAVAPKANTKPAVPEGGITDDDIPF